MQDNNPKSFILIKDAYSNGVFEQPRQIPKSNPESSNNKKFKTAINAITQKQQKTNSVKTIAEVKNKQINTP